MPLNKSICIVMPVYNEDEIIEKTLRHCHKDIISKFKEATLLVIDDKSTDQTPQILEKLKSDMPQLIVKRNEKNQGHGSSLMRGMLDAKADLVFLMDSDYQHVPADFWKLYDYINEYPMVTGIRQRRHDPLYRIIISRIGNAIVKILFKNSLKDINIPFKLIKGELLKELLTKIPQNSLIPSALLIIAANKTGYKIKQVPIEHLERKTGKGSLPGKRFLKFAVNALLEILKFRK